MLFMINFNDCLSHLCRNKPEFFLLSPILLFICSGFVTCVTDSINVWVNLFQCLALFYAEIWSSGSVSLYIFKLTSRCRCTFSFMLQLLYLNVKNLFYPLGEMLNGLHTCLRGIIENSPCLCQESNPGYPAHR